MGKIQGAALQTLGAVAAVAAGADKAMQGAAQEEEAAAIASEQGLLAKKEYHEASADLTKLEGESAEAGKALEETSAAYDAAMAKRPGGKGNTKAAIAETQKKALTEKEAADRAFKELQDKIEAKKAMMSRAEKIMKRTGTWGGMR